MGRRLNLQLPEPCSESWDDMRPEGNGRHCASCRKIVTDFTAMSDAELIAALRKQPEGCGRFREDQLERPLVIPRKPWPGLRYFFTITLPAFLLSLKAGAQAHAPAATVQTARTDRQQPAKAGFAIDVALQVSDEQGNPVPFATIETGHDKLQYSADANGSISLKKIPEGTALTVSATGFMAQTKFIGHNEGTLVFLLPVDAKEMEAVVVQSRPFARRRLGAYGGAYAVFTERRTDAAPSKPAPCLLPYPNPVSTGSDLHVDSRPFEPGAYQLELYNLAGQLILHRGHRHSAGSPMTLSTAGVLPGNYILRVVQEKTGKALSGQVVLR